MHFPIKIRMMKKTLKLITIIINQILLKKGQIQALLMNLKNQEKPQKQKKKKIK